MLPDPCSGALEPSCRAPSGGEGRWGGGGEGGVASSSWQGRQRTTLVLPKEDTSSSTSTALPLVGWGLIIKNKYKKQRQTS